MQLTVSCVSVCPDLGLVPQEQEKGDVGGGGQGEMGGEGCSSDRGARTEGLSSFGSSHSRDLVQVTNFFSSIHFQEVILARASYTCHIVKSTSTRPAAT